MPAFIVTKINITNMEPFKKYMEFSPATISQYGGRHIARGARTVTLEGEVNTLRNGIILFDNVEAAERWYRSPEYQEVKKYRDGNAIANFYVLEGL